MSFYTKPKHRLTSLPSTLQAGETHSAIY